MTRLRSLGVAVGVLAMVGGATAFRVGLGDDELSITALVVFLAGLGVAFGAILGVPGWRPEPGIPGGPDAWDRTGAWLAARGAPGAVLLLTLLIAVALLTQVFTRRGVAFALILAGTILYVAALDRAVLATHLSRLDNASAPVAERKIACAEATGTFFYGKTAIERFDAVVKDPGAPMALRELAAQAGGTMRRRVGENL